jgi:hypothetical protein
MKESKDLNDLTQVMTAMVEEIESLPLKPYVMALFLTLAFST